MIKGYKKYVLIIIPSLAILFYPTKEYINATKKEVIKNNVAILKSMETENISQIEKEIEKVQKEFKTEEESSLNYKDIFRSSVVMGDSQTEGLTVYNVLNSTSVVAKKGSNIVDGGTNIPTLSNLNPSNIFLLYGMNDILIYKENTEAFIRDYSNLIKKIKQALPDVEIFINAILPVTDKVIQRRSVYKNIEEYNQKLAIMCEDLEVGFVDASDILKQDESLFEGDGMHLRPSFYTKWLNVLRIEANL